ncbi:MAG: DMT family transporter [Halobacteriovoraceae bacterium]|nr:DMT family transporter [Halobacteriovoraceae bacterium]
MKIFYIITTFLIGCLLPIQGGVNNLLSAKISSNIAAAFFSFLGGTIILLIMLLLTKYKLPPLEQLKAIPFYYWFGGLLGAIFVTSVIFFAPRIGITTFLSIALAGQFIAGSLFDHKGWFGFSQYQFNWQRFVGILIIFVGVFLVNHSRLSSPK